MKYIFIFLILLSTFSFPQKNVEFNLGIKIKKYGILEIDQIMPFSYFGSEIGRNDKRFSVAWIQTLNTNTLVTEEVITLEGEIFLITATTGISNAGDWLRFRVLTGQDGTSQIGTFDDPIPRGFFKSLVVQGSNVLSNTNFTGTVLFMGNTANPNTARTEVDSVSIRTFDASNNLTNSILTSGIQPGSILQADTVIANNALGLPFGVDFPAVGKRIGDIFFKPDTLGIWNGLQWCKYAKDN